MDHVTIGDDKQSRVLAEVQDKSLQEKIVLFREKVVAQKGKVNAASLLRNYFSPAEMSNLWGRLKRYISSSDAKETTTRHWVEVCDKQKREGKQELKNKALCMQLAFPREWEDTWVHEVKKVSKVSTKGTKTVKYYRGELEQLHGVAEANAFIQKGKYVESEDSDGDICYRKTQKYEEEHTESRNEAELKSSTRVQSDDTAKVLQAMQAWWSTPEKEGSRASFMQIEDDPSDVMKKPSGTEKRGKKRDVADLMPQESESETIPDAKPIKSPDDIARDSARKTAGQLAAVSGKLLVTSNATKKTDMTEALLNTLKSTRKDLEAGRTQLLSEAVNRKSNKASLQKSCINAAKLIQEAMQLHKMAKAFKK